jgi:hypothetical protein
MTEAQNEEISGGISGMIKSHGARIAIAILIGYLILLGIGVIAEVFRIQSVLDWWIFKAPGS